MATTVGHDVVRCRQPAFQYSLHIDEHLVVLILHVVPNLFHILIEEFQYQHPHIIATGQVQCLNQFPADGGKVEIQEIGVGILQILHQ